MDVRRRSSELPSLGAFALATLAAASAGAPATRRATERGGSSWYRSLARPPFQPPGWVFGPVWTLLYTLIATSGWRAWRGRRTPARRRSLQLWAAQMALNGLWPWLFFGKHRVRAALVDCALLTATSAAYAKTVRPVDRGASNLFAPYLGWLAFATLLNAEILRRNDRRLSPA